MKSAPGEVLSTEIGPSTPPRVVVGVPPSDPPKADEQSPAKIQVEGVPRAPDVIGITPTVPSVTPSVGWNPDGSKTPTEPPNDPLRALETLEKPATNPPAATPPADDVKTDFAKTFVDAPKKSEEPADDKTKLFASTIAFGSSPEEKKSEEPKKEETQAADEKTKMFASTIAFGSSVKVDEPEAAPEPAAKKKNFAQTLAFGSSLNEPAAPSSATPDTQASPAEARLDTTLKMDQAPVSHSGRKIDEKPLEAKKVDTKPIELKKVEDKKPEEKKAADVAVAKAEKPTSDSKGTTDSSKKKQKSGSSSGTDHHRDDDVISEKFFSEGNLARHQVADVTENDALTIPDKAKRKSEPAVVQRRQRFVRYVTWAVGVAAVVCLAAVLRTTLSKPSAAAASAKAVVPTAAAAPEPKAAEPAVTATASADPSAAVPAASGSADPTAAAASADPAAAGSAAAAEEKKEELTGDPKEEKAKMRKLLETRKLDEAIEAGEKSVALDPTDGEAWLILGATYQEKGKLAEARRCYTACIKEGKTGPRHECGKMLR